MPLVIWKPPAGAPTGPLEIRQGDRLLGTRAVHGALCRRDFDPWCPVLVPRPPPDRSATALHTWAALRAPRSNLAPQR